MATTRAVLRQSQMLKKALFAGQVKPQTLVAARWGSGEPDQWNYLWRPDSKTAKFKLFDKTRAKVKI